MIGAALYVGIVGAFLAAAAWSAERVLASLRWPRRGAWIGAMLLSVGLPAWHLPQAVPDQSPVQLPTPRPQPASPPSHPAAASIHSAHTRSPRAPLPRPRLVQPFWTARVHAYARLAFLVSWSLLSLLLLGRMLIGTLALRRRTRLSKIADLDGVSVTITEDLGPAVLGVLRPRVLVPGWLRDAPAEQRAAALAHEREHLRAHDVRWLALGRLLVGLLPWNLPLWWLVRRLRQAIEVDCDARVVRGGLGAAAYGKSLLAIATRAPAAAGPAIDLFERRSQLGRRVRILVTSKRRWWRWAALPLYALAIGAALAAGTFPAPPVDAALGARNAALELARTDAAQRHEAQAATRRLLQNGGPDALAAAALLVPVSELRIVHGRLAPPADAAQRLTWLARAVARGPGRADLLLLEISQCRAWRQPCDRAGLDARLRALDPDNGVGWLDALAKAAKHNDRAGIDAALAAIGRTSRVDTYYTHLTAQLTSALHGIGGEPVMEALSWADSQLTSEHFDGIAALGSVCNPQAGLSARRVGLCRTASLAFEHGDTLLASIEGSAIARQLWPAGTVQHRQAAATLRQLQYMEEQSRQLMSPPGHRLRTLLDEMDGRYFERLAHWDAVFASEQEVLRVQLLHAGLRPDPPPGWRDPSP
ncbi:MAG: M56 family metallopeptidase [Steroidobacteraceae bacterium]